MKKRIRQAVDQHDQLPDDGRYGQCGQSFRYRHLFEDQPVVRRFSVHKVCHVYAPGELQLLSDLNALPDLQFPSDSNDHLIKSDILRLTEQAGK